MKCCILSDLQTQVASDSSPTSIFCQKKYLFCQENGPALVYVVPSLQQPTYVWIFGDMRLMSPEVNCLEVFVLLTLQQPFIL